ncbi:hypothetical protein SADUNF_Sadunf14G0031000 [Salix dunnii]|uniref:Uncharacterized protein n=1 Tax=Salix dunnii TaxID=1413687 RepID=A0A835JCK2_9ROSI|nr:hypothetical protein SADUNF_Sadunf14G0031000 [Salix dunnii]
MISKNGDIHVSTLERHVIEAAPVILQRPGLLFLSLFQTDELVGDARATLSLRCQIRHVENGNAGLTSAFVRTLWPAADIPLDNKVFAIPKGYNAPQQFKPLFFVDVNYDLIILIVTCTSLKVIMMGRL